MRIFFLLTDELRRDVVVFLLEVSRQLLLRARARLLRSVSHVGPELQLARAEVEQRLERVLGRGGPLAVHCSARKQIEFISIMKTRR